jgi:hypothetical protein
MLRPRVNLKGTRHTAFSNEAGCRDMTRENLDVPLKPQAGLSGTLGF